MKSRAQDLIDKLAAIARDPERATDAGHGFFDDAGKSLQFVASERLPEEKVAAIEKRLGYSLPRLIRRLYTDIGNGGFGPGYGLLPLVLNGPTLASHTTSDLYFNRSPKGQSWPADVLPVFDGGCGTLWCIRVQPGDDDPALLRYIPDVDDEWTRRALKGREYVGRGFIPEPLRLSEWLSHWAEEKTHGDRKP